MKNDENINSNHTDFASLNVNAENMECDKLPDEWFITRDITISAIEKTSLEEVKEYNNVPQVHFGWLSEKWDAHNLIIAANRELVKFTTTPATWRGRAGRERYAVLENGCVIDLIIMQLS